jgi:peptidoglycan/xylan/chitin deacetylase (PgdA/CDA1 family)
LANSQINDVTQRDRPDGTLHASLTGPAGLDWRKVLANGLYHAGLLRLMQKISDRVEVDFSPQSRWPRWRSANTPKFVILCYHRVGLGGIPLYSELPPEVFEAQMRFLKKNYRLLSLEELCRCLQEPDGSDSGVAVTFDDGYRDVHTIAFPILRKYQIPTTVFLTVDSIETGRVAWYDRIFLILRLLPPGIFEVELDGLRRFELSSADSRFRAAVEIMSCLRALPDGRRKECCAALEKRVQFSENDLADRMLDWEQVQAMQQAGIVFGSHTVSHPVVSRLAPAEMERELRESKQILEARLGRPVLDFAFPFGQFSDCALETSSAMVVRSGYRSAMTTVPGVNARGASPFGLRRVQIGEERDLATFALRLNQLFLFAKDSVVPEPGPSSVRTPSRQSRFLEGTRDA